jgi:hypothetical protein
MNSSDLPVSVHAGFMTPDELEQFLTAYRWHLEKPLEKRLNKTVLIAVFIVFVGFS